MELYRQRGTSVVAYPTESLIFICWSEPLLLDTYREALTVAYEYGQKHRMARVLVDQTQRQGLPMGHKLWLLTHLVPLAARQTQHPFRVALVHPPYTGLQRIFQGVSHFMSNLSGLISVETFPTEAEARSWLFAQQAAA